MSDHVWLVNNKVQIKMLANNFNIATFGAIHGKSLLYYLFYIIAAFLKQGFLTELGLTALNHPLHVMDKIIFYISRMVWYHLWEN